MRLTVYSQKRFIEHNHGQFEVDKVDFLFVSRWQLIVAFFTGVVRGEWPPVYRPAAKKVAGSPAQPSEGGEKI